MLHLFASTHPIMAIAIAFFASFYITGVCLVVLALTDKPDWFEDEYGELHYMPHAE